jgi:hypothetical protein
MRGMEESTNLNSDVEFTTDADRPSDAESSSVPQSQPWAAAVIDFTEKYAIFVVWAGIVVFFWILRPDTFGTLRNFQIILGSQATLLILTLGLLVALSAGEFDLSIGASLSLGATMMFYLDSRLGVPVALSVIFILVLAALVGLFNGFISVKVEAMRIHGGNGFTSDYPIERYYRDAPLMIIGEGTSEIQKLVIASQLLDKYRVD